MIDRLGPATFEILDANRDVVALAEALRARAQAIRTAEPNADVVVAGRSLAIFRGRYGAARPTAVRPPRLHHVPVAFDGPDLERVAQASSRSVSDVIRLLTERPFSALYLGFLPGFTYLGEVPSELRTPRLPSPRAHVAAGTLGLAGPYLAIYPSATPGGWNCVGRAAPLPWFDPSRAVPTWAIPGDRVQLVAADLPAEPPHDSAVLAETRIDEAALTIALQKARGRVTLQDGGRFGYRSLGVPWGGPLDAVAMARANRAVGNADDEVCLEVVGVGATFEPRGGAVDFSVSGSSPRRAEAGQAIDVACGSSLVAYLALRGGLRGAEVLGSRSSCLWPGLGARPLGPGDIFVVGDRDPAIGAPAPPLPSSSPEEPLRIRRAPTLGSRDPRSSEEAFERLVRSTFHVSAVSSRAGIRLDGPSISMASTGSDVSMPTVCGAVQLPEGGRPIVLGPDAATTGGYPMVGVLTPASLARLGSLRPGQLVRWVADDSPSVWDDSPLGA